MNTEDLVPLGHALRAGRKANSLTQEEAAADLGISRKTYILMESCRWLPPERERPHFARRLHELHPPAAAELARLFGVSLDELVEVKTLVQGEPHLDARHASLVFDAAILAVAEELDASPRTLRKLTATLLARLAAAGMPMSQACALAKGALARTEGKG